jgi:hypothetical protein
MILKGLGLRSMQNISIEGEALVTSSPITFLGFVNKENGEIVEKEHELFGQSIKNKIFVFPRGIGSTVAPYVLINLKRNNCAPLAIINRESDSGTVAGASASRIPMVYRLDSDPTKVIKTGQKLKIEIQSGNAKIEF